MCRNFGIKFLPCISTTLKRLGKHVTQTNPSKFDEMLFSGKYLCLLRLKQGREIQGFMLFFEAGCSRGLPQRKMC